MKKDSGHIAYYVSNYGTPPNFGSAEIAAEARRRGDPGFGLIATVAMEYSPEPGGSSPYTKFYVYDATGRRVNKADLDGQGDKYIPKLCVICHGGSPGTITSDARGDGNARFIPFDVDSFRYASAPGATRSAQETKFKELNRGIRDSTNVTAAVHELIDGWYGGPALPLPSHQSAYAAKGWRLTGTGAPPGTSPVDKSALYDNVVKPSCRSCHTTREGRISWDTRDGPAPFDGFKEDPGHLMRSFLCGPGRIMPHALVPYGSFWRSTTPHQPAALGNGGIDGWPSTYPCPCRDASDTNPANAGLPVCAP